MAREKNRRIRTKTEKFKRWRYETPKERIFVLDSNWKIKIYNKTDSMLFALNDIM